MTAVDSTSILIDVGTAAVSIIGAWSTVVWMVRGTVDKVLHLEKLSNETADEVQRLTVINGDSLLAIREKMTQMELWGRDNFVRRADWDALRTEVRQDLHEIKGILRGLDSTKSKV